MTRVLLYSGGMDSVAARLLWEPDVLVYVRMGTAYETPEMDRLPAGCEVVQMRELERWERPDGIIPLRNLFLVAAGAQFGEQVGLAATAGDRVLDKSQTFADLASGLLSYLWQPQHWTEGHEVQVVLPVKHLTKRQLVQQVGKLRGPPGQMLLAASFSCYTPKPNGTECGACKPCARKWVAFAAEGLHCLVPDASQYVVREVLPLVGTKAWGRGSEEADDVLQAVKSWEAKAC